MIQIGKRKSYLSRIVFKLVQQSSDPKLSMCYNSVRIFSLVTNNCHLLTNQDLTNRG